MRLSDRVSSAVLEERSKTVTILIVNPLGYWPQAMP